MALLPGRCAGKPVDLAEALRESKLKNFKGLLLPPDAVDRALAAVSAQDGSRDGIEVGHALAVYQAGQMVVDTVSDKPNYLVQLPDERGGELMVFRVFEKVSFGLIMEATRALHVNDRVRKP